MVEDIKPHQANKWYMPPVKIQPKVINQGYWGVFHPKPGPETGLKCTDHLCYPETSAAVRPLHIQKSCSVMVLQRHVCSYPCPWCPMQIFSYHCLLESSRNNSRGQRRLMNKCNHCNRPVLATFNSQDGQGSRVQKVCLTAPRILSTSSGCIRWKWSHKNRQAGHPGTTPFRIFKNPEFNSKWMGLILPIKQVTNCSQRDFDCSPLLPLNLVVTDPTLTGKDLLDVTVLTKWWWVSFFSCHCHHLASVQSDSLFTFFRCHFSCRPWLLIALNFSKNKEHYRLWQLIADV